MAEDRLDGCEEGAVPLDIYSDPTHPIRSELRAEAGYGVYI
jgi:hypothetical protein